MTPKISPNRVVFTAAGVGICIFAFASLFSFDVRDWPNHDIVSSGPVHNLCGLAGAWIAYHMNYWVGPAGTLWLIATTIWLILFCLNKPAEQLIFRVIGVAMVGSVIAGTAYLWHHGGRDTLSIGSGGVLGVAVGHFLVTKTALLGAILILIASLVVGALLAADNLVIPILAVAFRGLEQLRHAGPVLAAVGAGATRTLGPKIPRWDNTLRPSPTVTLPNPKDRKIVNLDEPEEDPRHNPDKPENVAAVKTLETVEVIAPKDAEVDDIPEAEEPVIPETKALVPKTVSSALANMMGRRPVKPSTPPEPDYSEYRYPGLELLAEPEKGYSALQEKVVREKAVVLEKTLEEFNIDAKVVAYETGPVITMFELQLAPGVKVSQISNLSNDLARSLGAGAVRVVAPIPGKHTIGIEVPNLEKEKVRIKELMTAAGEKPSRMHIPLFLGKDASGEPLVVDLTSMPHLLIAGTTGSGKSVCINSIIISILMTQRPDLVKMILVDPKMVEMSGFREVPHLMCPIVTEMKRAEQILEWLTIKMDERYALLAEARVRNIADYNKLTTEDIYERFSPSNEDEKAKIPVRLSYMVVIIDELADLMMTSAKEVESYIIRIAQKSRAVGIHLVLATQRPQATVVTGLIKSNLPCRISFRVAARMDSRIVLDQNGAEALLGQGDMLYLQPGTSELVRAQGTYLSDDEINRIINFLKEVSTPSYHPELTQLNHMEGGGDMERDEMFDDAVRIVLETKRGSVSLLQRRLTIGYSRASRLVDQMAIAGIVGEYKGSQAREVLITLEEYDSIKAQMDRDAVNGYSDLQEPQDQIEVVGAGSTNASDIDDDEVDATGDFGMDVASDDELDDASEVDSPAEEVADEAEDAIEYLDDEDGPKSPRA